jgi:hypothetical protein
LISQLAFCVVLCLRSVRALCTILIGLPALGYLFFMICKRRALCSCTFRFPFERCVLCGCADETCAKNKEKIKGGVEMIRRKAKGSSASNSKKCVPLFREHGCSVLNPDVCWLVAACVVLQRVDGRSPSGRRSEGGGPGRRSGHRECAKKNAENYLLADFGWWLPSCVQDLAELRASQMRATAVSIAPDGTS